MLSRAFDPVVLHAPATVGNMGPGFDVCSLALSKLGDRIRLSPAKEDAIEVTGPGQASVPEAWGENLAGRTLDMLRQAHDVEVCFQVDLHKPRAAGSGLGSSASSAAGVALAFHSAFPELELTPGQLIQAAGRAEGGGQPHYDDVAAVVLGGLSMVRPGQDPPGVQRVAPPDQLRLAVVVPELQLDTAEMRRALPDAVPRQAAVANLANVALMVDAFHRGDVPAIGACLDDRIAVPHRAERIPFYETACKAACDAGAHGATLSGSGPSLIAVCTPDDGPGQVAKAMAEAVEAHGHPAEHLVAQPEMEVPFDAM